MTANRRLWKALVFFLALIVLSAVAWQLHTHFSLERLVGREDRLRDQSAHHPWESFLIGLVVYAAVSLIPGLGGKAIVCGWLFGFWKGVPIVVVGLTVAAMIVFSLSRHLLRDRIERRYARFLGLLNKHLQKEGAFYLLTLRMAHAPYSIINPVSGASRVGAWTFLWTTFLGLLPGTMIWVYLGQRLPSLKELATQGPGSLVDGPLVLALVGCATLPILVRWLISRFGFPGSIRSRPLGSNVPGEAKPSRSQP